MPLVWERLNRPTPDDVLTVGTFCTEDTVPLGTDLDPRCYNNLWSAGKVKGPMAKTLVQRNLALRVLDAENIGFSYGDFNNTAGQARRYDINGVKKAVHHFKLEGIDVVVVTKRRETKEELQQCFTKDLQVVLGYQTDDVFILKEAERHNCPIVSNDNFRDWREDLRLGKELREFMDDIKAIQVRFSWNGKGDFEPDFELPKPPVKPKSDDHGKGGGRGAGKGRGRWGGSWGAGRY